MSIPKNIIEIVRGKENIPSGQLSISPYIRNFGAAGSRVCGSSDSVTVFAACKVDSSIIARIDSSRKTYLEPIESTSKRLSKEESGQGWFSERFGIINNVVFSVHVSAKSSRFGRGEKRSGLLFLKARDTAPLYKIALKPEIIDYEVPHFLEGRFDILTEDFVLNKGLIGEHRHLIPAISTYAHNRLFTITQVSCAKVEPVIPERVTMSIDGDTVEIVKPKKKRLFADC